jgi:hypothetical protein
MILIRDQNLELLSTASWEYHCTQTGLLKDIWSLWIPFPTTQNHVLDVSSELGWLRNNGLGVMLHYDLDQGSNFGIAELNLWNITAPIPTCSKTYEAYRSPSQPPKIMSWVYQVNWDG